MQLSFLCEKSGAIALVLPGLMAGRLAVLNLESFKILYRIKHSTFCYVYKAIVLL